MCPNVSIEKRLNLTCVQMGFCLIYCFLTNYESKKLTENISCKGEFLIFSMTTSQPDNVLSVFLHFLLDISKLVVDHLRIVFLNQLQFWFVGFVIEGEKAL